MITGNLSSGHRVPFEMLVTHSKTTITLSALTPTIGSRQ